MYMYQPHHNHSITVLNFPTAHLSSLLIVGHTLRGSHLYRAIELYHFHVASLVARCAVLRRFQRLWHPSVPESRCSMFSSDSSRDYRAFLDRPHVSPPRKLYPRLTVPPLPLPLFLTLFLFSV